MAEFIENKNIETPESQGGVDIEAIVKDLFDKGADKDEIIVALNKMKEEGKISDEEVKRGVDLIEKIEGDERAEAEKLFGLKFVD